MVMKITDNMKVDSYSYEIVKNGTVVKQVENSKYTSPITITLTGEGTYVIRGHAIDEWGNKTDKASKKYVIDNTWPDCSKIKITSTNNSVKQDHHMLFLIFYC